MTDHKDEGREGIEFQGMVFSPEGILTEDEDHIPWDRVTGITYRRMGIMGLSTIVVNFTHTDGSADQVVLPSSTSPEARAVLTLLLERAPRSEDTQRIKKILEYYQKTKSADLAVLVLLATGIALSIGAVLLTFMFTKAPENPVPYIAGILAVPLALLAASLKALGSEKRIGQSTGNLLTLPGLFALSPLVIVVALFLALGYPRYWMEGSRHLTKHRPIEAKQALLRAVQLSDGYYQIRLELALLALELGDNEQIVTQLVAVYETEPSYRSYDVMELLPNSFYALKRYEESAVWAKRIADDFPDDRKRVQSMKIQEQRARVELSPDSPGGASVNEEPVQPQPEGSR